jgi:hypothetical protein
MKKVGHVFIYILFIYDSLNYATNSPGYIAANYRVNSELEKLSKEVIVAYLRI